MSEEPESRRRRFPLRILTLVGILVSTGVGIGAVANKHGEIAWCVLLPFAAGLAIGDLFPKRDRFDVTVVVAAPFFSLAATGILVLSACLYEVIAVPWYPVALSGIVRGVGEAAAILPEVFIGGAIPSIVGAAVSSFLKRCPGWRASGPVG